MIIEIILEFGKGTDISEAAREAVEIVKATRQKVKFGFNGEIIEVGYQDDAQRVVDIYQGIIHRKYGQKH